MKTIAYLHPFTWQVGSAYKYFRYLMVNYGGVVTKSLKKLQYRPDIVVCRGDKWLHYLEAIKEDIPYLLIEHDVYGLRMGVQERWEREKVEKAAAIIFTSEDHLKYYQDLRYELPYHEVIHLRPLKEDLVFLPQKKLPGKTLVYAGGMVPLKRRKSPFGYRAYQKIFQRFIDHGWEVHIYPHHGIKFPGVFMEYQKIGCCKHSALDYHELIAEMSQYTAGFQGYNIEGVPPSAADYIITCRPNKTWDYLAAGIPTIGYNTGNTGQIYNGKWGVVLPDLEDETLQGLECRLPDIDPATRIEQVMEADKDKFERIMTEVFSRVNAQEKKRLNSAAGGRKVPVKLLKVSVLNISNRYRERAGHVFLPGEDLCITVGRGALKEISACKDLEIYQTYETKEGGEMLQEVTVRNRGAKGYIRAGRYFAPNSTSPVIKVSEYQLAEIGAVGDLSVDKLQAEQKEPERPAKMEAKQPEKNIPEHPETEQIEKEEEAEPVSGEEQEQELKQEVSEEDEVNPETIEKLNQNNIKSLRQIAKENGIPNYWLLKKEELIQALALAGVEA